MITRVLVVDDSPTIRKVVSHLLDEEGYECVTAEDGEDALAELRREPVDLVLTDFVMPKMNGYQLCRELRADPALRNVPVVLMSAKGDKLRGHFIQQTGAVDAITKPFDPMALVAVIESALTRKPSLPQKPSLVPGARPSELPPNGAVRELRPSEPPPEPVVEQKLSDDPAIRRTQLSQRFGAGLAKMVVPALRAMDLVPIAQDEKFEAAIRKSVTADQVGSLAGLLRTLDFGPDPRIILSGDLSCISIAEVLQMLELQRQTGALSIASPSAEIILYVRDGAIDLAQSRGLPASFRLGRYLVQQGALRKNELARFVENRADSKRLFGDALVQEGLVTEANVRAALKEQTSELVYEVVGWKAGRFTFARDVTCPEATLSPLALAPGGIVMEGFRRVDEWRLIEGSFDFGDTLQSEPQAIELVGPATLTEAEQAVLLAIDGQRTVRQIVDAVPASTFDVCKILYQLLNSKLVRRRAA
ncbi:MAG TPA: response regulator [Polyangiaceae bacterium]|jgi:CheY-like chemotaxis protein|nr:response regulator [Polyangiaceae bacterium]